jgi:hypothetical protein
MDSFERIHWQFQSASRAQIAVTTFPGAADRHLIIVSKFSQFHHMEYSLNLHYLTLQCDLGAWKRTLQRSLLASR